MALVQSIQIPLGSKMPAFILKDPHGKTVDSNELYSHAISGLMVAFLCNHCPYAIAVWPRIISLAVHAKKYGMRTVAINPNIHPDYPEDNPSAMKAKIIDWEIPFPYLVDESQDVAREFDARCTPDIFLFDEDQKLVYHGRVDDNWQDEGKVKHQDLKLAIDACATAQPINSNQIPAMGCSIKWQNHS